LRFSFFFFCYSPRPHRSLHSFPTRRSSDLSLMPDCLPDGALIVAISPSSLHSMTWPLKSATPESDGTVAARCHTRLSPASDVSMSPSAVAAESPKSDAASASPPLSTTPTTRSLIKPSADLKCAQRPPSETQSPSPNVPKYRRGPYRPTNVTALSLVLSSPARTSWKPSPSNSSRPPANVPTRSFPWSANKDVTDCA